MANNMLQSLLFSGGGSSSGGGGVLVVGMTISDSLPPIETLDKTWAEITAADFAVISWENYPQRLVAFIAKTDDDDGYNVRAYGYDGATGEVGTMVYTADSVDGYPSRNPFGS